jgi:hypothetical protein
VSRTSERDTVHLMRFIGLLLTASLVGCVEPGQYGGPIPIDPIGTTARLESLCAIAQQPVCGMIAGPEDAGTTEEARATGVDPAPDAAYVDE